MKTSRALPLLVIIDMQSEFKAANDKKTSDAIVREIQNFRSRRHPILVVEYEGCGPTRPKIMKALRNYNKRFKTIKWDDGGAPEVCMAIAKHQLVVSSLAVCGVNTCACVYKTVFGMAKALGKKIPIEIVEDGVSCSCSCSCSPRTLYSRKFPQIKPQRFYFVDT